MKNKAVRYNVLFNIKKRIKMRIQIMESQSILIRFKKKRRFFTEKSDRFVNNQK